jgi:hypothetical protein
MTLLPSVDTVVRQFMPVVLDAAGQPENANRFRGLQPVLTIDSVKIACKELSSISHEDPVWIFVIEDLAFWIEAAAWAAVRNDHRQFTTSIDRAHTVLRDGLDIFDKDRVLN